MKLVLSTLLLALSQLTVSQVAAYQTSIEGTIGPGNGISKGKANDDIIYVTTREGQLYTIRESTGDILNTYDGPNNEGECTSIVDWAEEGDDDYFGAYAVGNRVVLVGPEGEPLRAFNVPMGTVTGGAIVKNGLVYVASNDLSQNLAIVSVYDPALGRIYSQQTLSEAQIGPLCKNSGDKIYFGSATGMMFALNVTSPTDQILRYFSAFLNQGVNGRGYVTPDLTDLLIVGTQGKLFWWDSPIGAAAPYSKSLLDSTESNGEKKAMM